MLSWSLTTAETEELRVCLAPTPLPGNAFAPLWAQAGAGEGQNGTIPPPSSSCYCRWLGGGGSPLNPSRGPSLGQWCRAQRSHPNQGLPAASAWPRSRAAAGLSWVLGRLQAWVPPAQPFAPSGEVPRRRESSARVLGCQPWHQRGFFLFSAHDLPFLLGRSQVRDIQESPWDEFPSEEAVSPSPPAGLASRPARHTEGHPLPLDTSCQVQLGANLPSCSWVLVIQA